MIYLGCLHSGQGYLQEKRNVGAVNVSIISGDVVVNICSDFQTVVVLYTFCFHNLPCSGVNADLDVFIVIFYIHSVILNMLLINYKDTNLL